MQPGEGVEDAGAYVALGDSISIDTYAGGPGRGGASLLARNRDDDFPAWHGKDLAGMPFHLLATDGATTATLLEVQVPRVAALRPSLVTLTIGGNDLLAAYGRTRAARRAVASVREGLRRTLGVLGSLSPVPRVVVGTVYDPTDGTGNAAALGLPPWPSALSVLAELNEALRAGAAEHGAAVAEIHRTFRGHGLARGDPAQPDPRPADPGLWYCHVIEPNAWGASGVRAAFWESLRGRPWR
ncbi:SGNH/GDSL hydrolase family protein [Georgenia sp. AZ-5]|uniref:SGNH/GDSL hydrolase family protein n=1 Tax=Georgenia sp. AZ-5 TaxID=3367526 RepID=UPI0037549010